MPMVGQDTIRQDPKRMTLAGLNHDALERIVIAIIAKQMNTPNSPIEDVIN